MQIRYLKDVNILKFITDIDSSTIEGDFLIYTYDDDWKKKIENNLKIQRHFVVAVDKIDGKFGCTIDMMKKKQNVLTLTGGVRTKIDYISREEANDRAKSPIVYRDISYEDFLKLPLKKLDVIPLHYQIIDKQVKNVLHSLFIKHNLVDISLKFTERARKIRQLPFGLRPAIIALEGYEGIVVASLIDSYETTPFLSNDNYNQFRGNSDIETFLYMFIEAKKAKDLKKWCKDNKISYSYMDDVINTVKQSQKILNVKEFELDVAIVMKKMEDVIPYLYDDRLMNLDVERTILAQYLDEDKTPYTTDSINLIEENRPLQLYSLISYSIPGQDLNTICVSFVPPSVKNQMFESEPVVF